MLQKCSFETQQQILLDENIISMTTFIRQNKTQISPLEIMFKHAVLKYF